MRTLLSISFTILAVAGREPHEFPQKQMETDPRHSTKLAAECGCPPSLYRDREERGGAGRTGTRGGDALPRLPSPPRRPGWPRLDHAPKRWGGISGGRSQSGLLEQLGDCPSAGLAPGFPAPLEAAEPWFIRGGASAGAWSSFGLSKLQTPPGAYSLENVRPATPRALLLRPAPG